MVSANLLVLLKVLLSLADGLTSYLREKNLMDAGAAKVTSTNLKGALDAVKKAQDAKSALRHDPDSLLNDPHNRDRGPQ